MYTIASYKLEASQAPVYWFGLSIIKSYSETHLNINVYYVSSICYVHVLSEQQVFNNELDQATINWKFHLTNTSVIIPSCGIKIYKLTTIIKTCTCSNNTQGTW